MTTTVQNHETFQSDKGTHALIQTIAESFGEAVVKGNLVNELHLQPQDYYLLRIDKTFSNQFDGETSRKLIETDVVGYVWGATVKLNANLNCDAFALLTRHRTHLVLSDVIQAK